MVTHMAVLSGLVPSGIEWLAGRIKLSSHGVKMKRLIERLVDSSVCCLGLSEVGFVGWVGVEKMGFTIGTNRCVLRSMNEVMLLPLTETYPRLGSCSSALPEMLAQCNLNAIWTADGTARV